MKNIKKIIDKNELFFSSKKIISAYYEESLKEPFYRENKFPSIKEIDGIKYHYNSHGHRCDEFKNNHLKKHILFAGCSETFGVCSPYGTAWPEYTYNFLDQENSGFFKLGHPGGGWQLILKSIMNYIDLFGDPDELYILFPNLERKIEPKKIGKEIFFLNIVYSPIESEEYYFNENGKYTENEYLYWFFEFKERMILFEKFCKLKNINLYWSTHMLKFSEELSAVNEFSRYVDLEINKMSDYILDEYSKKEIDAEGAILRSDGHAGYIAHKYWAKKFLDGKNKIDKKY